MAMNLKRLYDSYKLWVQQNPQTVSDLETTAKWVSYFIAGRISEDSSILTELIYSLSNILVLFHDRIIENDNKNQFLQQIDNFGVHKIKLILTTLEYCEVFIEISARKFFGNRGKWCFIVFIQIFKTLGRFFLMKHSTDNIVRIPPIAVLDRKKLKLSKSNENGTQDSIDPSFTFKLKRSGRTVRKVEGAPPMHLRNFIPLNNEDTQTQSKLKSTILTKAEIIYIAKPLIHLGAIGIFGYKSWKSYGTALLVDLISIRMYYRNRHLLTKQQKLELSRRCVNLLLYLVRSPFYEHVTEQRMETFLMSISKKIPFAKTIANPLMQYIPKWQETYFYMWSN